MHPLFFTAIFLIVLSSLLILLMYFYHMDESYIRRIWRTFRRDIRALILYSKIYIFGKYCRIRNLTIVDYFNNNVEKNPSKVCFVFEDEEWTYVQLGELSNKIAHCFAEQGYQKGDEVALLMENCPDYICIWLGLAKIGVITALINTNNKGDSLAHSLNIINMKGLIFGQGFAKTVEKVMPSIQNVNTARFYSYARQGEKKITIPFQCEYLHLLLDDAPACFVEIFKTNFTDKLMYMYTSGSTGLPKAAIFTHGRYVTFAGAAKFGMNSKESHIFYNTLPFYHITGGFIYLVFSLVLDHKMILRRKFSSSAFWKEVVKHKVTISFYIGEICRYLLNQPETPEETQHSLEILIGSCLKPHLWKDLLNRFKIKKIVEIYGSTEGNIQIVNYVDKVGAVGFICRIFSRLQGMYLIKVDQHTGEIMTDSKGFCIPCKPGEPGELIGEISANNPFKTFEGYLNEEDTKTKIIRNFFRKGDVAFLTGDILTMDEDGYLFFKERLGECIRRKGENISLAEVENIVSKDLCFAPCIVYEAHIPGKEGNVCMAVIQVKKGRSVDLENLYECLSQQLPYYAIPVFIRISCEMEKTGTYKLIKMNYKEQGYNPGRIRDPLYILDPVKKAYVPLTKEMYYDIVNKAIKC